MWLILSIEQPSVTAVVSRLPAPVENLAAFGLTFSLAMIVESPVVMLLTTATALATHRQAYRRLLSFTHLLALGMTLLHLLLGLTPLYAFILRDMIGAPEGIIETSRIAFLLMTPWTAMIAYRRLMEGIMIGYDHPQRVTLVIVARLSATAIVLIAGLIINRWPGAAVGGLALSIGVTAGAFTAWLLARPTIRNEIPAEGESTVPLNWRRLGRIYVPLALSATITMIGQPVLSFGLSRAARPLESLAIWPVVMSLLFIARSGSIAYQEVVVALLKDASSYRQLRRFVWVLSSGASAFLLVLVLTPGATLWYRHISGLEPSLLQLAIPPTAILSLVPGLNALIAWQRGILVHREKTSPISTAVGLNMATMVVLIGLVFVLTEIPGAILASTALTVAMTVECLYLRWQLRSRAGVAAAEATPGD